MPCSFDALPNELVLQVAQYLDDYDLACLLCCAHWTLNLLEPVLVIRDFIPYPSSSCVQWAVAFSHISFVELFMASGIHPDRVTDAGESRAALYIAVLGKKLPIAKLLLAHGADPNRVVPHGDSICDTALHLATLRNNLEMIRLLAEHGADMSIKTIPGDHARTPLHYAVFGGDLQTVEVLLELGANVEDIDGLGLSALRIIRLGLQDQCAFNLQDLDVMVEIGKRLLLAGSEMWDIDGLEVVEDPECDKLWYEFQIAIDKYSKEHLASQSSNMLGGEAPGNVTGALG